MEDTKIQKFLKINYGDGDGYGYGDGDGSGYGDSSGYGDGSGSGDGNSDGSGSGRGSGSGHGSGYGYGYGNGRGYGDDSSDYGDGYKTGDGVKSFNGKELYDIDGIPTAVLHIRGNIAKGFTLNPDLTTNPCYIVKQNNTFAHGATLAEAQEALLQKLFKNMPEEERINMFAEQFNAVDKYPAKAFFDWHNRLTGSCLFGRLQFIKDNNINLEDMYTVEEFVQLTKGSYGGEIVLRAYSRIKEADMRITPIQPIYPIVRTRRERRGK